MLDFYVKGIAKPGMDVNINLFKKINDFKNYDKTCVEFVIVDTDQLKLEPGEQLLLYCLPLKLVQNLKENSTLGVFLPIYSRTLKHYYSRFCVLRATQYKSPTNYRFENFQSAIKRLTE